jgi:hypothetical protein
VEAFVARTQLAERLASVPFTMSGLRVRRVGGAREDAGRWSFDDSWLGRDGALISPVDAAPRRVVVLANEHTVMPRAVLGLLATGRATLVAEQGVRDDALAPSATKTVEQPRTNSRAASMVRRRSSCGRIFCSTSSSSEVPVMKQR